MNKSIIVLLSFLTFLLPVGSSMIISNVMAFEDYRYEANEYEQYTNDNYYKSQGSDLKKIKCNNINNNFNEVNISIGTGDPTGLGAASLQGEDSVNPNGYDKRSGNGNFDLDCTNNNNNEGIEGPEGPEGPQGLPGEQGPPGITFLNATNMYLNETRSEDLGIGEFANLFAVCDPGDVVVSGGYFAQLNTGIGGFGQADVQINRPVLVPFAGGWNTGIELVDASPGSFYRVTVYAFCFDNPPLHTATAAASISTFQQQQADSPVIFQGKDSSIISQGIENSPKLTALEKQAGDSPELTAMEKLTKIKTQWLSQLP